MLIYFYLVCVLQILLTHDKLPDKCVYIKKFNFISHLKPWDSFVWYLTDSLQIFPFSPHIKYGSVDINHIWSWEKNQLELMASTHHCSPFESSSEYLDSDDLNYCLFSYCTTSEDLKYSALITTFNELFVILELDILQNYMRVRCITHIETHRLDQMLKYAVHCENNDWIHSASLIFLFLPHNHGCQYSNHSY